jgi:MSHA biogenesis protein MshO
MRSKATSSSSRRFASAPRRSRGVTLVELVVVLVLLGIITAVAGMAMKGPVDAYLDSTARAELTEMADGALRRIARDLQRALPNSPRVTGGDPIFLEMLLTRTGGRYRAGAGDSADVLDFNMTDTDFDSLGNLSGLPGQMPVANDILVIYNLFATGTQANAYTYNQGNCTAATPFHVDCNTARITGAAPGANGTRVSFVGRQFPLRSPGNRFHVVEGPVTYICNPAVNGTTGDGEGTLIRVSNYTIAAAQPTGGFGGGVQSLLANHVAACEFVYNPLVLTQSLGLVSMRLQLIHGGETVTLYHEVHVSNLP